MTTPPDDQVPQNLTIARIANRGIIVWIWLGLLTAYISTSALIAGDLFAGGSIQFERYDHAPGLIYGGGFIFAYSLVPCFLLITGWGTFFQLSLGIFDLMVYGESPRTKLSKFLLDHRKYVRAPLKFSIGLLILTWVSVLVTVALLPALRYL